MRYPTDAIVAVTLNCNSRCVMCDIWKNEMEGEMSPEEYRKLPGSLQDINISGGEPFLRSDLPAIVKNVRQACPRARLVVSSHGFMPTRIEKLLPEMLRYAPQLAMRISIDGMAEAHENIRGIKNGFDKTMQSLEIIKGLGVKDVGIGMTVMEQNVSEVMDLYLHTKKIGVEFSLTVVNSSPIYFGEEKASLRADQESLQAALHNISRMEYRHWSPKRWFRGWFDRTLVDFSAGKGRPFRCDGGSGFFYLDSMGDLFICHILSQKMGNIREQSFGEIWHSAMAAEGRKVARGCDECWMVCTGKSQIRRNLPRIGLQMIGQKLRAHITSDQPIPPASDPSPSTNPPSFSV